ncbi:GntR family transcriptional regulator [Gordonia neofelifaecis]|uniref:Gntr domain protein n=1 Tax=Gordonia neofelifaecis NRRL B-59395 TaxID=644548 RepID=F1YHS7_9ACTN|nr:GntR family transcriptional regulator [Gordonia neofelifaecis]EGD55915.1 gntr domain protein [Gordonia neofelifaecis NRRL B-59395]
MANPEPLLRTGTTVDDLHAALRERVISGDYPPGARMSQAQLAAEFNVSRTPLREALQRLEADGLLIASANRGMHVAPVVNSETEESYALRLLIEPPTVSGLIDEFTTTDFDEMRTALDEMRETRGHGRRFQDAHDRFHDVALNRYPASFRDLIKSLHIRIYRHQRVYLAHNRTPDDFIGVDNLYLDALISGESGLAHHVLQFHLTDAALGLVLDADSDHRFASLLVALRGRGIDVEHTADGTVVRPAAITWSTPTSPMPSLRTSNLVFISEAELVDDVG